MARNSKMLSSIVLVFSLVLLALGILGASGCNSSSALISGVTFSVPPNVETLKVQLNFANSIQSDLGGTFEVAASGTDYGTIEIEPSSPSSPFNVGFLLNLNIVNEQKYVNLTPVQDLPSGQPIPIPGLNRAFAKIQLDNQLNPNFDIYAYVDVAGKQWIGLALTLKFLNNKYFPAGLSLSQGFVKDAAGNNQIYGAVFGPKVDNAGNMTGPGGIALFANAATLIANAHQGALPAAAFVKSDSMMLFQGPHADFYNKHPRQAAGLAEVFRQVLKSNSFGNKPL
ncbi:MAG: hypothetical protein HY074_17745 [Deltaproteobacteria bacterium]|nr:hypothetical protein [Deltaproteobacteria bacterium]